MNMRTMAAVLCCILLSMFGSVRAEVPERINYQGRLVEGSALANGVTSMVFRLYDQDQGGTLLYQETQTVTVVDGLYSVHIGANNPAPGSLTSAFGGSNVYLEVAVGGTALTPRERVVSVAYALNAGRAGSTTSLQAGSTNLTTETPFQDSMRLLSIPFTPPFDSTPVVTISLQSQSLEAQDVVGAQVAAISMTGFTVQTTLTGRWISLVDTNTGLVIVRPTSLAVVNGKPAMTYSFGDVRYQQATDANGLTWTNSPAILNNSNNASYTSLAVVNGRPAVAYRDDGFQQLEYVRANDADGRSWPTSSIVVDTAGNVGNYCSLAVINGKPAVGYYDSSQMDLKYIQAGDVNGAAWTNPPVTVDGNDASGLGASLSTVNGAPAISYLHIDLTTLTGRLMYVRGSDADGASWRPPVIVDDGRNIGFGSSLAVVGGRSAIAYQDATQTNILYIRASDAVGDVWGSAPVAVHPAAESGQTPSLAIIGGRPAIAYAHDEGLNRKLRYVQANDTVGAAWGDPVYADDNAPVGKEPSLVEINGRAAIGYWGNSTMQYVIDGGPAATLNWIAAVPE